MTSACANPASISPWPNSVRLRDIRRRRWRRRNACGADPIVNNWRGWLHGLINVCDMGQMLVGYFNQF